MVVLPVAWLAGRIQLGSPLDDLVCTPTSAFAQEIYFRASLLFALNIVFRKRKRITLLLHAALLGLRHLRHLWAFHAVPLAPLAGIILTTTVAELVCGTPRAARWHGGLHSDATRAFPGDSVESPTEVKKERYVPLLKVVCA